MSEAQPLSDALDHLRQWFSGGLSGCYFANAIAASSAGVAWVERLEDLAVDEVSQLEGTIDGAAELGKVVVVAFPRARATSDAAVLLRTLVSSQRWTVTPVPWTKAVREGCTLVGLKYQTTAGDLSSVMGLGPFGEMPVTRRAPYMAISLWAGGRMNQLGPGSPVGEVGFPDGPLPPTIDADKFQPRWDKTQAKVKKLLAEPPEARGALRHVAFCLPNTELVGLLPGF